MFGETFFVGVPINELSTSWLALTESKTTGTFLLDVKLCDMNNNAVAGQTSINLNSRVYYI